jgi:glycosyltransferase involved in cell wall biosynthesis
MPEGIALLGPARPAGAMPGGPVSVGLLVGGDGDSDRVHCGVRDYTVRLAQAMREIGVDARVLAPATWGVRDGPAFVRRLRAERWDVLHLQYPSIGHRHSLLPHLLGLVGASRRFVVTLHEHSALPRVQRVANALFRATADRLVFTTDYEAEAYGAPSHSPVIPIGSNVPVHPGSPEREDAVLYFGQIRPGKGIEAFLALAGLSATAGETTRFVVVGSAPPRWRDYCLAMRAQAPANVDWMEAAPFPAVARAMASALAAYLPFPDGAGPRRGSLMAALANGLPVIAPLGPSTTEDLRAALLPAATPEAALAQLRALRAAPALAGRCAAAGRALAQRFAWPAIAAEHAALYRALLAGQTAPAAR